MDAEMNSAVVKSSIGWGKLAITGEGLVMEASS